MPRILTPKNDFPKISMKSCAIDSVMHLVLEIQDINGGVLIALKQFHVDGGKSHVDPLSWDSKEMRRAHKELYRLWPMLPARIDTFELLDRDEEFKMDGYEPSS